VNDAVATNNLHHRARSFWKLSNYAEHETGKAQILFFKSSLPRNLVSKAV